jgi:hypothetical protein
MGLYAGDDGGSPVKYMLLMYAHPAQTSAMSASERDAVRQRHATLGDELTASGELLNGAGLAYPSETSTLRLQHGVATAVVGPLAHGVEQLTAYYVIECASSERARSIGELLLDSHVTGVELRRIHDSFGMDEGDTRTP